MANILVLEDIDALRRMLADVLSEDGHTVTESGCGSITRDSGTIANVDVMITDLYMPRSDGIEAIMMAKKAKPGLKIIAISGHESDMEGDYLSLSLKLGANEVLRKPFEPEEMLVCVRDLLAA